MTRIDANPHRRTANNPGFGGSFWVRFSAHHRPADNLLDSGLVARLGELDKLQTRWNAAVSECLNLDNTQNLEAAQREDEDANADAARNGGQLPGPVNVRDYRQRLDKAILTRDSYARACEISGFEIGAILSDITTPSGDTIKAADDVTKALAALRGKITAFLTLEARDAWISLAASSDPANKVKTRGIIPELQNAHLSSSGDDTTTLEAVLNSLESVLKLHTEEG
jgi:hypothetical protein